MKKVAFEEGDIDVTDVVEKPVEKVISESIQNTNTMSLQNGWLYLLGFLFTLGIQSRYTFVFYAEHYVSAASEQ